jgi:Uma2 family endonuclease
MSSAMLAVPSIPRVSADDNSSEFLFEIIDGQRVEMPPMSAYAGIVSARLVEQLVVHNHQQTPRPGRVFPEVLFRLPLSETATRNRRPDIAFVSFERAPIDQLPSTRDNAWSVVPELAIEVISPSDLCEDQLEKVLEYFVAGVRLVWVVYPTLGYLHVYSSQKRFRSWTGSTPSMVGPCCLDSQCVWICCLTQFPRFQLHPEAWAYSWINRPI